MEKREQAFEIYRHGCTSACGESCDGDGFYWMETTNILVPVGPYADAMKASRGIREFQES